MSRAKRPPTPKSVHTHLTALLREVSVVYSQEGHVTLTKTNEHGTVTLTWKDGHGVLSMKDKGECDDQD